MRKALVVVGLVIIVLGVGFLWFQRGVLAELWGKLFREQVKGYTPAKTPNEALSKFREACKDRDYKSASMYCGGPYYEHITRAAEPASKLGEEIDALQNIMDKFEVPSKLTKDALRLLDPFPSNFDVKDVKEDGDKATAVIVETEPFNPSATLIELKTHSWYKNPAIFRSLSRDVFGRKIELRAEGDGDQRIWKIYFPVHPELPTTVGRLVDKQQNYTRGLEKIKTRIRAKDIITKDELEAEMKNTLNGAEE
jgi:hypothetical protein